LCPHQSIIFCLLSINFICGPHLAVICCRRQGVLVGGN
jgi:hypothetical protein